MLQKFYCLAPAIDTVSPARLSHLLLESLSLLLLLTSQLLRLAL